MPVALSTQSYSHTFEAQLESILSQYNEIMESDVSPFTLSNHSYNFMYLADKVYVAISQDLVSKSYNPLQPIELYELTNGEAFLLSVIVRNINLSLAAGGNSGSITLRFIPNGAVESVDGELQRFVYNGTNVETVEVGGNLVNVPVWQADIPQTFRQGDYLLRFKMPTLSSGASVNIYFTDSLVPSVVSPPAGISYVLIELRQTGGNSIVIEDFVVPENSISAALPDYVDNELVVVTLSPSSILVDGGNSNVSQNITRSLFTQPVNVLLHAIAETAITVPAISAQISYLSVG